MPRLVLFYRLIVRPMLRERARSLLVLASVALGVAVVLAIDLAGNAAAGSFRSSMETLSGDNDLEVVSAGGVPDKVVGELARLPYSLRISPRIEDHATVVASGETVPLIGVDLIGEAGNLQQQSAAIPADENTFRHINDRDAIWVNHALGGSRRRENLAADQ